MDIRTCVYCGAQFQARSTSRERPPEANRFCSRQCHYDGVRQSPIALFWRKVDKDGPVSEYRPDLGPCWLWLGQVAENGYGRFRDGHRGKRHMAHRFSWELENGPWPVHLQADHLCRVPACVRPSHVEPVTARENQRRIPGGNATKTHCKHGHEFTVWNTVVYADGRKRGCRACAKVNSRASYLRKRAA